MQEAVGLKSPQNAALCNLSFSDNCSNLATHHNVLFCFFIFFSSVLSIQSVNLSADLVVKMNCFCFSVSLHLYFIQISPENLLIFPLHLALIISSLFPSLKSMNVMAYTLILCNIFPSKGVI